MIWGNDKPDHHLPPEKVHMTIENNPGAQILSREEYEEMEDATILSTWQWDMDNGKQMGISLGPVGDELGFCTTECSLTSENQYIPFASNKVPYQENVELCSVIHYVHTRDVEEIMRDHIVAANCTHILARELLPRDSQYLMINNGDVPVTLLFMSDDNRHRFSIPVRMFLEAIKFSQNNFNFEFADGEW